jgi:GT2 family glycosyltransferase
VSTLANPDVAIIILNWNGWSDTIECLDSLDKINYTQLNIILIDNGSDDNSIEQLENYLKNKSNYIHQRFSNNEQGDIYRTAIGTKIVFIKNDINHGFARGNNIGMEYASRVLNPKYIILLNNDTIVSERFLSELIAEAEKDPRTGICGAKLLSATDTSVIDSTGHIIRWGAVVDRGNGEIDKGQYDNKLEIVGAMAACCLYRKDMLDDIGLFDESFHTAYEDAELSWRAFKSGWKGRFVPTAIVYHKRGKSIRRNYDVFNRMILLGLRNSVTTVERYGSRYQLILFAIMLLRSAILLILGRMLGRNRISIQALMDLLINSYISLLVTLIKR